MLYPEFDNIVNYGGKWAGSSSNATVSQTPPSLANSTSADNQIAVPGPDYPAASGGEAREGAVATPIVFMLRSKLLKDESFTLFRNLVANGLVYEEMVRWLDTAMEKVTYQNALKSGGFIWEPINDKTKRNIAKSLMVRVMFGQKGASTPLFQVAHEMFRHRFDLIGQLFAYIKTGNHKVMARLLQRIESFLVLEACMRAIRKTKKSIPVWTIHDSIVTTEYHAELVKSIMLDTIESYVGIKPSIEVEYWKDLNPQEVTFLEEEPGEFLDSMQSV